MLNLGLRRVKIDCCGISFQMFDHCLAPNTMGDGTGCDNMTCIIVVLNARTDTQSLKQSDSSEADSSSKEDTSVDKQTGVSDQQEPASSSSGEMDTQQESGSGTEKQIDSEKQGENDKGTEKRPRENCVADSPSKCESQPEKRARLEESTVT